MANVVLQGVTGRTFEFDAVIINSDGEEYELQDGDKLFFLVSNRDATDKNLVNIRQADKHFKIKQLSLMPDAYAFEFGIVYSNGDAYTIINRDDGLLKVLENAGDVDATNITR
ncbi:MAG TPA: hypothetical protein H9675_03000 [Firmicutes bacterium]|nr:hypothetical protein [Bacillota bacterium]